MRPNSGQSHALLKHHIVSHAVNMTINCSTTSSGWSSSTTPHLLAPKHGPSGSNYKNLWPQSSSLLLKPLLQPWQRHRQQVPVNSNIATTTRGHKLQGELSMRDLGLRRLIQGENTNWTLPHETLGPGAQLQCSTESHSLRATIEGQQRPILKCWVNRPRHVRLPLPINTTTTPTS
jgi:hypothetical protein